MGSVITLYLLGTFLSAALAVVVSFFFPTTLHLVAGAADAAPPQGISEVMTTLLKNVVDNPVKALMTANYIGILGWALILGGALRHAPNEYKRGYGIYRPSNYYSRRLDHPLCPSWYYGPCSRIHCY